MNPDLALRFHQLRQAELDRTARRWALQHPEPRPARRVPRRRPSALAVTGGATVSAATAGLAGAAATGARRSGPRFIGRLRSAEARS